MERPARAVRVRRKQDRGKPDLHAGYRAMRAKPTTRRVKGFGLIELMIAMAIGLVVAAGVIVIFVAERQVYSNSSAQALIQDADNAISAVISPVARGTGFVGCGAISSGIVSYIGTHATPLTFDTTSSVKGFTGTVPTQVVDNSANDTTAKDWTPTLDASLVKAGGAEQGSDVISMIGAAPGASPIGVQAPVLGSPILVNDVSQLSKINGGGPQMVAISDCGKSSAFEITSISGTSLAFSSGPNGTPAYPKDSQIIPLQQTVFFVGKGDSGQSALFRGVMTLPASGAASGATWTVTEMVPGVIAMKALYGTGPASQATEYFDASGVTDWTAVTTVRLGFLVEGPLGSAPMPSGPQTYQLLNAAITVPADTRLRHVFSMTINPRNDTL
ncbi:MAG TPA: PilW family protein [Frateuria sp.]|nr:PilW family protein [Frateuria sp.]